MVNPFFADISRYAAIGKFTIGQGAWSLGTVFTNYGDFRRTDAIGTDEGSFSARDYAVQVGRSHSVGLFTLGANLKFAGSSIDGNSATAVLGDLGGIYRHPSRLLSVGMVFSNFGFILADYGGNSSLRVPFDVRLGTTFKPQYMPIRFTFTIYDLTEWNKPFETDESTNLRELDAALRHLNAGLAFLFGSNVEFLVGYNQKRRQELKLEDSAYGAGLSFGILLKIRELQLRFTRSSFHAAGGTSFISLQTNYNALKKIF